jgi:hypothetical protein
LHLFVQPRKELLASIVIFSTCLCIMVCYLERVLKIIFCPCSLYKPNVNQTFSVGLTAGPIGRFIKRTALNPAFTVLFILAAQFTKLGSDFASLHPLAYSRVTKLFYFCVVRWISGYLDSGALNNWTKDQYNWEKEIVLIMGGAGEIGGNVVNYWQREELKSWLWMSFL